jgi:lipocalin
MKFSSIVVFGLLAGLVGCSSPPPIQTSSHVDLNRFMGDWYVIANIPTFIETKAFNAMESYRLNEDGTIATTFTFFEGGFDGEEKSYHPTAAKKKAITRRVSWWTRNPMRCGACNFFGRSRLTIALCL